MIFISIMSDTGDAVHVERLLSPMRGMCLIINDLLARQRQGILSQEYQTLLAIEYKSCGYGHRQKGGDMRYGNL